jgi:nuclear receptor subfamily 1 group I
VLKEARGNIYEEHQRFLQTFSSDWRNDESIMLLLGAITLFSPDRPNVVHQDVIKLEQVGYTQILPPPFLLIGVFCRIPITTC